MENQPEFILNSSKPTLNFEDLSSLFNFKLKTTKKHFNSLIPSKDKEKILESQKLTEFFTETNISELEFYISDLNTEIIDKGLELAHEGILSSIKQEITQQEQNMEVQNLIKLIADNLRDQKLPNQNKMNSICEGLMSLADNLENVDEVHKLLTSNSNLNNMNNNLDMKIVYKNFLEPLENSHNKNFSNLLIKKIFSIIKSQKFESTEFISTKTERKKTYLSVTNPTDILHKFVLNTITKIANEIETEAEKILSYSTKIKRVDDFSFKVPKTTTMEQVKKFSPEQDNLPIFIGSTKTGLLLSYTKIKNLNDSVNTLREMNLMMDANNIFLLCKELKNHKEELEILRNVFIKIDLHNSYSKTNFNHLSINTAKNNCAHPKFQLKNFFHPLIFDCIRNDLEWTNCNCNNTTENFITLSGPNTSGKTTILRSIAIIVYLNQLGAPVPAEGSVPLFDCIRLRIGAEDSNTESTYFKEMKELKQIIDICDDENIKPLVLIDELGRGTSIIDGIAMSMAVKNFLVKKNVYTIFVTHFDELKTEEERNMSLEQYRFVNSGGKSYGIQCAKESGFPEDVVEEALMFFNNS